MKVQGKRLRSIAGTGILAFFSMVILSCTQGEDFQYVRIERDETPAVKHGKADMAIVFTGSTNGEFDPGGCGGVYEGGFARRSTVLETLRRANRELLLLDTGDLTSSGSVSQTEFIDQAYGLLRYDAIAVSEGDLRVGVDTFNKYARQHNLPFVSSNLKFKKPSPVSEVISVKRAGKRLAIFSVISDRWLAVLPMSVRDEITYESPLTTLRRLVPQLRQNYDGVILLSHLGPNVREAIAPHLTGVDLWIDTGGHQWAAATSKSTIQTPTGTDQKSINAMCFFPNRVPPMFISWQNDRKIGVAGIKWTGGRAEVPLMDMISLAKGMVEDKQFLDIYDAYKYVSRQEMIKRLMSPSHPTTKPAGFGFVTSDKCGTCHQEIYDFWKTTKHARAFTTLKKGNRDTDVICWACHTTGFREDGGFSDPAGTPTLVNVGCQDCHHKDLKNHPTQQAPKMQPAGGLTGPSLQIKTTGDSLTQSWHCNRCHVPHRSPMYEYKSYLKRISCSEFLKKAENEASKNTTRP